MSTIEAMATGLPVIVSRKGGLKEYIINEINGFFVEENKPVEDIVEKIEILISNPVLREYVARVPEERWKEDFHGNEYLLRLKSSITNYYPII